jgi:hypothetical protein
MTENANKSLQPTPVGRLSSAFAVDIARPAWLSSRHHAPIASGADFFSGSCTASFWWWDFVSSRCGYEESRIVEDWWLDFFGRSSYFMFAACGYLDLFRMPEGFQIF